MSAYFVGFALGFGAWAILAAPLADGNALLYLVGGIIAGVVAGWALGTAIMLWLA